MLRWTFPRSRMPVAAQIEKERVGSTVQVVALASLVGALVWAPLSLLIFPGEWLRSSVVVVVVAGSLLARRLARRGRVRAAAGLLVAMLWAVFTSTLYFDGGSDAPGRSGLILVVVTAGLLLGPGAALGAAALCVATLGAVALLDVRGAIPPVPFVYTPLRIWWIESVYYAAGGVLLATAASRLREAFGRAHRSEQGLEASRRRYLALAENSLNLVVELDGRGHVTYVSPSVREILGREADEVLGSYPPRFLHPEDQPGFERQRAALAARGRVGEWQVRVRHRDGRWLWMEGTARSYQSAEGKERTVVTARDVTERVQALSALRANDERLRTLAEQSSDLVAEFDADGRVVYVSPNHRAVLGYEPEELVGRPVEEALRLIDAPDSDRLAQVAAGWFQEAASSSRLPRLEQLRHRDGSPRWVEVVWSRYRAQDGRLRVLSVSRDVTERLRMEEQLRQTQRLESLGVLAGGIAHDFNNLLTAMLGNASLARQVLAAESPAQEYLEDVEGAAARAAELTGQLLAYAGRARRRPRRLDLSEQVRSIARLLETSLPAGAHIDYELASGLPPVDADPAQLQQVVFNLVTNAAEAVGGAAGTVTVRTTFVDADRKLLDDSVLGRTLPEGRYLRLAVTDTGCGMDAATLSRVFEPFFTTKFVGRGLGLAALLGIAQVHRGSVRVQSEPGRGTTFEVLLPAADGAAETVPEPPRPAPRPARAEGTVLVVDDQPAVVAVAQRALEAAGYRVLTAASGEEALDRLAEAGSSVVAALLDFSLPGRNGRETLHALRQLRPGLPILLSSGYDEQEVADGLEPDPRTALLSKPYRAESLVERLDALLAAAVAFR